MEAQFCQPTHTSGDTAKMPQLVILKCIQTKNIPGCQQITLSIAA